MKLKLPTTPDSNEPAPAPAPVLDVVNVNDDGSIDCAFTVEPKKSRVIVLAPPPDDPVGYRDWLQNEAIPKLVHLPADQFAERIARIVFEHEEKMGSRIAFHAGRIKGRLNKEQWWGHEKDLDAISRMAGVTIADKHAGITIMPPTGFDA